jgi:predicted pyridoxine 5'-phosphate oxidase superfamily flavin-nucleotide-binding protein
MKQDFPYHPGELAMQARTGSQRQAQMTARAIKPFIPDGAMQFIGEQNMIVVSSRDMEGGVWASILFGAPGFLSTIDSLRLRLNRTATFTAAGDPVWENLQHDPTLGLLLIDLGSRKRLRINGHIRCDGDNCLIIVEHAYANCPRYIQSRQLSQGATALVRTDKDFAQGERLTPEQRLRIAAADTFFVASAHPQAGCDASHRGGLPGFVEVMDMRHLRIPEYAGNGMFNTLGNFSTYPLAGLVFPDFENKRLLQMTGKARVRWHDIDSLQSDDSQPCYWQFELKSWRESHLPAPLESRFIEYSPHL